MTTVKNKIRILGFGVALTALVSIVGCTSPQEPQEPRADEEFVVRIDSVVAPAIVAADETFFLGVPNRSISFHLVAGSSAAVERFDGQMEHRSNSPRIESVEKGLERSHRYNHSTFVRCTLMTLTKLLLALELPTTSSLPRTFETATAPGNLLDFSRTLEMTTPRYREVYDLL